MLMNTTSFLASHLRATISAAFSSTVSLTVALRSKIGLLGEQMTHSQNDSSSSMRQQQQQHEQEYHKQDRSGSLSSKLREYQQEQLTVSASAYHQQELEGTLPLPLPRLAHEQYPSLQPWKNLDRRIKNFGLTMPVSANYIAPRHPIVLCHGLFGFDKMGPVNMPWLQVHYWNGIHNALTKLGAKVVVAGVPRTGAIRERAEDLNRILSATMEGSSVNFIAHSMGGLDSRYLISHIHDKNYHVESLTTFSTPHRGSPMMDWFRDNIGVGFLQQSEEEAMRKLGEEASRLAAAAAAAAVSTASTPESKAAAAQEAAQHSRNMQAPLWSRFLIPFLDTPAYANLTTEYCTQVFNPNTPNDPQVAYYSYGASVPRLPIWAPLGFPWEVINAREGENDGLVSVASARWGKYIETVECDHWDLNNRWRLKIGYPSSTTGSPFDAVELYMSAATRLFHEGH
ncbi:hypothetical protein BGZ47_000267 [Haplosporangium gracile]|nr:hypothetical protein BGZ47_000267 [Haplosporangium gracile]